MAIGCEAVRFKHNIKNNLHDTRYFRINLIIITLENVLLIFMEDEYLC